MLSKLINKINFKSFSINTIIYILAVVLANLGIGCFYVCKLGTDPISVLIDGLHLTFGLSYGTISTIFNSLWAVLIILFLRDKFGIGTFLTVLIGGPLIDVFTNFLFATFPPESTHLAIRLMLLVVGEITFAVGTGLTIGVNLGIGCWSFLPLWLEKVTPLSLDKTQMITDAVIFVIGWFLGGVVGIGTILGVLATGPIIGYVLKVTAPMFEKIGPNYK
ncbi:MAG TPA: YitT family protein [Erysipelotrichaceae bacterium]|jgi:uncharacterized membrane protein YczE|nr:YitT family protein [Erysipelotrichaceae bacterium]HQA85697.1 YitT family protein [Erysipelotrichaceae bacterium]